MTRIIAGELGGRRIDVPATGTRPTSDRVREAMFSRLDHQGVLDGARVLDLYAGSGALGIESLSRGAREAMLVEAASSAARVLQANVRSLGLGQRAHVIKERALTYIRRADHTWDLVFVDPPYDIPRTQLELVLAALEPRLAPGAPVVLEWTPRAGQAPWPPGIEFERHKDYGDTRLHWAFRSS